MAAPDATSPDASGPAISISPNGPLTVFGPVTLVRRRKVVNSDGDYVDWESVEQLELTESVELCRCGLSREKPFCDKSHLGGFTADDQVPPPYDDRARTFDGVGVTIRDDRRLCVHTGFCITRTTNVWRNAKDTGDAGVRNTIVGMVQRCPSGALTVRFAGETTDRESDPGPVVAIIDDGPLAVIGDIPVTLADGTELEPRYRRTLCRCGASAAKPLCDGCHIQTGFRDQPTGRPD